MAMTKAVANLVALLLLVKGIHGGNGMVRRRTSQNDEYMNYPRLEICDDLIIQVTDIVTLCDSPQTYFYGSGVNRNSRTCNYGDKATTTVYFDVTEDLYDTKIYVVMSVYAGYGNEVLTATSPKSLKKYVGYNVQSAGSYSYTYTTTLGSSGSGSGKFIPYIQIAFSSQTNGDYNLGAANIPCRWDDQELGEWTEITAKNSQFTSRDFLVEYGILIATVMAFLVFVAIFSKITKDKMNLSEGQNNNRYLRNVMQKQAADEKANALMPEEEEVVVGA